MRWPQKIFLCPLLLAAWVGAAEDSAPLPLDAARRDLQAMQTGQESRLADPAAAGRPAAGISAVVTPPETDAPPPKTVVLPSSKARDDKRCAKKRVRCASPRRQISRPGTIGVALRIERRRRDHRCAIEATATRRGGQSARAFSHPMDDAAGLHPACAPGRGWRYGFHPGRQFDRSRRERRAGVLRGIRSFRCQ